MNTLRRLVFPQAPSPMMTSFLTENQSQLRMIHLISCLRQQSSFQSLDQTSKRNQLGYALDHSRRSRALRDAKTASRDCGPSINTPSHNAFFLLRHFDAFSPGRSDGGVGTSCDNWLGQRHRSKIEKSVRSTVGRSDWLTIRLDTGKSGNVELMTRWSGVVDCCMGGRVGTRDCSENVGEAGEELQSDRVGLMSRREIERLRSRLELQSGLCFRVSGCSLDYASSAELQGLTGCHTAN